jgi:prolipoprotein diacylglyceryltransferase
MPDGSVTGGYLFLYGLIRFLLQYLRADESDGAAIQGLDRSQIGALVFIVVSAVVGVAVLLRARVNPGVAACDIGQNG